MTVYLTALAVILGMAIFTWLASLRLNDVSFVDSLWSLFFLAAAVVLALATEALSARALLVLALVAIWAVRLSLHITVRNWGDGEDYRYQAIRARYEPGFRFKSLYIVFGLQGLLAWIAAAPLLPAITGAQGFGGLDVLAAGLWLVGFFFQAVSDYQLQRFKSDPSNEGSVLDSGLWRYTRHPNYFGEFCMWWAIWLFAVAAGGWWTVFAPLLISFLLLRVSGVALLEKTIGDRRPKYTEYIARTNAFFPGPPRAAGEQREVASS